MTRRDLRQRYPFHVEHKYAVSDRPVLIKPADTLRWLVLMSLGITALIAAGAWLVWVLLGGVR